MWGGEERGRGGAKGMLPPSPPPPFENYLGPSNILGTFTVEIFIIDSKPIILAVSIDLSFIYSMVYLTYRSNSESSLFGPFWLPFMMQRNIIKVPHCFELFIQSLAMIMSVVHHKNVHKHISPKLF